MSNDLVWGAPTTQQVEKQLGPIAGQKKWADGVPMIDTERGQLQVVLDAARAHADVRRPDGRKSPTLLVAEEVFRLQVLNDEMSETLKNTLGLLNASFEQKAKLRAELLRLQRPWYIRLRDTVERRIAWWLA